MNYSKEGAAPVFKSLLFGRPIACEILLERIPLDSIPEDPAKASEWLQRTYVHKVSLGRIGNMCVLLIEFFEG